MGTLGATFYGRRGLPDFRDPRSSVSAIAVSPGSLKLAIRVARELGLSLGCYHWKCYTRFQRSYGTKLDLVLGFSPDDQMALRRPGTSIPSHRYSESTGSKFSAYSPNRCYHYPSPMALSDMRRQKIHSRPDTDGKRSLSYSSPTASLLFRRANEFGTSIRSFDFGRSSLMSWAGRVDRCVMKTEVSYFESRLSIELYSWSVTHYV